MTDPTQIKRAMQTLFSVWDGTKNASDILTDTALTIGNQVYKLEGNDLCRFAGECGSPQYREYAIRENERIQRRQGKLPRE